LRAFVATFQGRIASATAFARQAFEQLPQDEVFLRSLAGWILSAAYMIDGKMVAGSEILDETVRMSMETGNLMVAVGALTQLARLHEARRVFERAIDLAADKKGRPLPIAGRAMMGLADL